MFDSRDYPQALDELLFESWLQAGRESRISYTYLLIVWDELEQRYFPEYVEERQAIQSYEPFGQSYGRQALVAAYDLYSESRIA